MDGRLKIPVSSCINDWDSKLRKSCALGEKKKKRKKNVKFTDSVDGK